MKGTDYQSIFGWGPGMIPAMSGSSPGGKGSRRAFSSLRSSRWASFSFLFLSRGRSRGKRLLIQLTIPRSSSGESKAIKLYRTRGLNPRVRPKGRAAASPLRKPHRLCARFKRRAYIKSSLFGGSFSDAKFRLFHESRTRPRKSTRLAFDITIFIWNKPYTWLSDIHCRQ